MRAHLPLLLLLTCTSGAACAGASRQSPSPQPLPPNAWQTMNESQRAAFMKNNVVPVMQSAFHQFDPRVFDKVDCEFCHGARSKHGDFTMPNPDLPKLSPEGEFKKHRETQPEITRFMMQTVVPDMAGLLGMPRFNPQTKQGFGCFDCHTEQK